MKTPRVPYWSVWPAALLATAFHLCAEPGFTLEPILQIRLKDGSERLARDSAMALHEKGTHVNGTAFVAIAATEWPAGLVPVFETASLHGYQLRRLPPRGQENQAEPLFFALPPSDETNAVKIAGFWNSLASNTQRSNHSPDWELAIDGEQVAGRFDPHGEIGRASCRERV